MDVFEFFFLDFESSEEFIDFTKMLFFSVIIFCKRCSGPIEKHHKFGKKA